MSDCILNAMDLLDFDTTTLYYEQDLPREVEQLIQKASSVSSDTLIEGYLKLAWFQAPRDLTVLVALYRFYYYKHRLQEALDIGEQAISAAAELLDLPADWREVSPEILDRKRTSNVMGLVRFYLHAVKGTAVLCLRLGRLDEAIERLRQLSGLDSKGRLGAKELLQLALNKMGSDSSKERFPIH